MQVKIMEDDTIEETIITIRCRKKDEKIKTLVSILQMQDHKLIGRYRGEDYMVSLDDIFHIKKFKMKI